MVCEVLCLDLLLKLFVFSNVWDQPIIQKDLYNTKLAIITLYFTDSVEIFQTFCTNLNIRSMIDI